MMRNLYAVAVASRRESPNGTPQLGVVSAMCVATSPEAAKQWAVRVTVDLYPSDQGWYVVRTVVTEATPALHEEIEQLGRLV